MSIGTRLPALNLARVQRESTRLRCPMHIGVSAISLVRTPDWFSRCTDAQARPRRRIARGKAFRRGFVHVGERARIRTHRRAVLVEPGDHCLFVRRSGHLVLRSGPALHTSRASVAFGIVTRWKSVATSTPTWTRANRSRSRYATRLAHRRRGCEVAAGGALHSARRQPAITASGTRGFRRRRSSPRSRRTRRRSRSSGHCLE